MAFAGEIGAEVNLNLIPADKDMRADHILFSESNSRFIIEVKPENADKVSELLKGLPLAEIGRTADTERLIIKDSQGVIVDEDIFDLKHAWQAPLKAM